MSFVDAHDFSVDLVLRVLGIPASTYYDWRARRTNPGPRACADAELLGMIDAIRGRARVRGHLRLAAGVAGAAAARGAGLA